MATGISATCRPRAQTDADMARGHAEVFLELLGGQGLRPAQSAADVPQSAGPAAARAVLRGPARAHLVGRGVDAETVQWTAKMGMNLQSSTLVFDETGKPFHVQQAEQIRAYKAAWKEAGHTRTPRISVQPLDLPADQRSRPRLFRQRQQRGSFRLHRADQARRLRPLLCRRARQADRAAARRRGHPGSRYAAAHRAQPARRRLQRARHRVGGQARRAGARLALSVTTRCTAE